MIKEEQWDELFKEFEKHADEKVYITDVLECSTHFLHNLCASSDPKNPVRGFKEFLKQELRENQVEEKGRESLSLEWVDSTVDAFILNTMFSLFATYAASFLFHGDKQAIASFSERVGGGKLVEPENKNLC